MTLFLITILSLYGLLHFYIFHKIQSTLALGTMGVILLLLFMATMVTAPVLVHLSEKHGRERSARLISYTGYTWMGFAFLFFCFSFMIDLYGFCLGVFGTQLQRSLTNLVLPTPWSAVLPAAIAAGILSHGYFQARDIRNETLIVQSPKIPREMETLRIAQISDVHLGLIVRQNRLERIVKVIRAARPDILVSTGDLVDGQINRLTGLAALLRDIQPKYGKFAVMGNHEFYAGLNQSLNFIEEAGFTLLRGEALTVAGIVNIAGVDDPTGKYFGLSKNISEGDLLSKLPRENFTLLLKHTPRVDRNARGLFDLQLSGHTHNGQLFPFSLLVRLLFPREVGLVRLSHESSLYVSRGSGTWGPPMRFLSPPEVTVIKLVNGDKRQTIVKAKEA